MIKRYNEIAKICGVFEWKTKAYKKSAIAEMDKINILSNYWHYTWSCRSLIDAVALELRNPRIYAILTTVLPLLFNPLASVRVCL